MIAIYIYIYIYSYILTKHSIVCSKLTSLFLESTKRELGPHPELTSLFDTLLDSLVINVRV